MRDNEVGWAAEAEEAAEEEVEVEGDGDDDVVMVMMAQLRSDDGSAFQGALFRAFWGHCCFLLTSFREVPKPRWGV